MSEKDFNILFGNNLKYQLSINNISQVELANKLNVSATSVSNWCKGTKTPRMDKVDAICELLGIRRSDLMSDKTEQSSDNYYINPETREIAQEIYENPNMRTLFDVARDIEPERLKAHIEFMKSMKKAEEHDID